MLDLKTLPRMIDVSCVKADITLEDLNTMVEMAKKYRFVCCFAMPSYTQWLIDQLKDVPDVAVGGAIGFPSGADMAQTKAETARRFYEMGVTEFDMVINVSALKSKDYDKVCRDMEGVRKEAKEHLMKVILETSYLTDEEIVKGCELAVEAGTDFVKTGTGWGPKPTTVDQINLMREAVKGKARIKAAGGVKTLDDIIQMTEAGCSRFGIGVRTTLNILKEAGLAE